MSREAGLPRALGPIRAVFERLALSRAKHRSLAGHPRIALALSRCVPDYQLDESHALRVDGAPPAVRERRAKGLAAPLSY